MFYVLEVTQTKQADGTIKTEKGVYSYDTLNQAKFYFVQGHFFKYTKPAEPETEA